MTGFWKVFGATAASTAVAVTVVALVMASVVIGAADRDARSRVRGDTELLAAAVRVPLQAHDTAGVRAQVARLAKELPELRMTVIAPDGTVLADSHEDAERMANHSDRDEVIAARRGDATRQPVQRFSATLRESQLYFAERVTGTPPGAAAEELLGFARASLPEQVVAGQRSRLVHAVVWSAVAALAIGLVAAGLITRSVRRPLAEIETFVDAVARGQPARRLPQANQGELSHLVGAVNAMADQLDERFERLDRDQSEIRTILGSMVEGVLAIDQQQRVLLLNSGAAAMLGTDAAAARGKPVWEVTRIPEVTGILARCLQTNLPAEDELMLPGDPHDRVLRLTAAPLGDDRGAWGCVLVLHDLTEMRRLETVRRDFVVNVSHELKTPLTAMKGFLEAVIEDSGMDEETRRRFLVRASDNTDRMVAIVTDLLTLARVEAADGALKRERIDLREICSEALAQAGGVAAVREISLQVDLPGEAVTVAGDRTALTTAVMNLLDNAIKYSPRGGRVRMRVVAAAGKEAVVDVEDNGPGIPSHETERIFERFYRVDKNRSRELGGTGLGLSIVRNVMLAHGGRVTVSSVLGEGSTFRLHIPLLAEQRAAVSSGAGPAA